jgi:DNA polymerase-3 subunit delta'
MPGTHVPWPSAIEGSPAATVLENAMARRRLAHALLLQGEDLAALTAIALAIADRLLNAPESSARFPVEKHPDFHRLRPAGRMRIISADTTRALISKVQVSPAASPRKVALIEEADRMNTAAANVFLKTLEEPPRDTTLLLVTTRPHALLPTIRSRVQLFRFPSPAMALPAEGWAGWMEDYQALLGRLADKPATKHSVSDSVFSVYGLIARFSQILALATEAAWETQKAALTGELSDEEEAAVETGISAGLRARLLGDIERATRAFAAPRLKTDDGSTRRALIATVEALERSHGLLAVNLNEGTALEDFLLATLRAWSRR